MRSSAQEVRRQAQRSAEAAKDTSTMIEESSERSNNGVAIAERVGSALEQIGAKTQKVNILLAEIASASKEQTQGIDQITTGVGELDTVTQENAGNAQRLAAGAEETAAQVGVLRDMISRFSAEDDA